MAVDRWDNPAPVIVGAQNDAVRLGAGMAMPDARAVTPQHRQLVALCRESPVPLVGCGVAADPHRVLLWEWSPVLEAPRRAFRDEFWCVSADAGKGPIWSDIIELLAMDAVAQIRIEESARGAFHHGHKVTLVWNGVPSPVPDSQGGLSAVEVGR